MPSTAERGRLPENIMHFTRVLRVAGLPLGPDRSLEALRAVDCVGVERRDDLHAALAAVLVTRCEQHSVFDQAFHVFWRNPRLLERALKLLLPRGSNGHAEHGPELSRRVAEALAGADNEPHVEPTGEKIEVEASLTWSDQERLQHMDFEAMGAEELAAARRVVARMRIGLEPMATRRYAAARRGTLDPRATLRASLRGGGRSIELRSRARRRRPPALVVLCDISGSMSQYARIFLQFLHAATDDRDRVHTLLFGTRLTDVTRQLRRRDADEALAAVGQAANDWSGGTRIGACLRAFNRYWARRLLGRGAVVLLITDGLDRDAGDGIDAEARRLRRGVRELIWLNPLLRYERFAPRPAGVRALLPHVDQLRPVHNLRSLGQLAEALGDRPETPGERFDLRAAARGR